jgi:hypothetical protein
MLILLAGLVVSVVVLIYRNKTGGPMKRVPDWILAPSIPEEARFKRYHPIDFSRPIPHIRLPQHPFMAAGPTSNMHNDASMSDTYEASGPLGINPQITTKSQGFGGYGTITFDKVGRLVAVYGNAREFKLVLLDSHSLDELASYDLPPRSLKFLLEGVMPWKYIGAGMYFFLDNQDRAVVPTTTNHVLVIQVPNPGSQAGFQLVREYDLSAYIIQLPWPKQDSVAWVLPDWQGAYYWFATTAGMVGTINIDTGEVLSQRLEGEIIENSIAVGPDGVFIISDKAQYRFNQDGNGVINQVWRTAYDPGPGVKPGLITRGSGTSVTLLGDEDGFVAITDNAEPQIHLMFIRRSDGQLVCNQALFKEGKSANDITAIGFEQADGSGAPSGSYTAIVENNWGPSSFPFSRAEPGITRVDLTRQEDGSYRCQEVWTSNETNIGVFKLSLGNGLLYTYYHGDSPTWTAWYFKAIDFRTGVTVYEQLTGTGMGFNNWAGVLFLHPEGGIAYSTTIFGLVKITDSSP